MAEPLTIRGVVGKWYQTLLDTSTAFAFDAPVTRTWAKTAAELSDAYTRLTHQHIVPVFDDEFRIVTGEAEHAIQETTEVSLRLNISHTELSLLFADPDNWVGTSGVALMSKLADIDGKAKTDRNLLVSLRWQAHLREAQSKSPVGYLEALGLSRSLKPAVANGLIILAERDVPPEYILESGALKTLNKYRALSLAELYENGVSASLTEGLLP